MSQDVISDVLNQIMNAKRAGKTEVVSEKHSKLLLKLLELAKAEGYIKEFKTEDRKLIIQIGERLNKCKSIKPRYNVRIEEIDEKVRRFLPSRGFGILIISSSKGLITHVKAYEQGIGGQLLAYFY